jgi:E3 ubiquitin-protein ligase HERC1
MVMCYFPAFESLLKNLLIFRDLDPAHPNVVWLWEILESLPEDEKVLFVIFVCGRSRLPAAPADLPQRFQILRMDKPVDGLPTAQTCFFQLRLPPYTSKEAMARRLAYAIHHCRNIDMDNYMLQRENNANNLNQN